ncbi:NUDIX domain-containing protein [Kitasatospora sp. YST-16]|uniref:NUDIX hydrolase n=1 Tax=Kitasatospora sp. YST-16 TaxID=2998080 RepID=UPI002284171C|nr:NUDIX domain-containing protein [Kitasatospora sp. YST-16]WAL74936.1 NUDIX domain-containing protein [Kitasatospora sp. YST-16]WNW40992.1 NUDIX domain-containing protein [Streptomyces sp. Li-HN-5-13]
MTPPAGATPPAVRYTSRLLLLDHRDRLLLLCARDPRPAGGRWWFTVGGGVDEGEDALAAAVRELREETSLDLPAERLGPVVWTRRTDFTFDGRPFRQWEEYRLLRLTPAETAAVRVDPVEARFGHHWWTVRELATTDATVRPHDLAAHLTTLLREGPGPVPLHLGDVNDDEDRAGR